MTFMTSLVWAIIQISGDSEALPCAASVAFICSYWAATEARPSGVSAVHVTCKQSSLRPRITVWKFASGSGWAVPIRMRMARWCSRFASSCSAIRVC